MDDAEARFRRELAVIEEFIKRRDYFNAHSKLLVASRQFLADRYPFDVSPADCGLSIAYNGHLLGVVGGVVHGVIKGRTKLEDVQRSEIGKVLRDLNDSPVKLRILVVRDLPIKHVIVNDLSEQLDGVEVWTTDDLCSRSLPIRG